MKFKSLLLIGSMAAMGAAFTSCAKENLYDSEFAAKQQNAEYEANFVKKYGAIDPNQTWDFASMKSVRSLPSTRSVATRAGETPEEVTVSFEGSSKITIEKGVIDWMHLYMPAGKDHTQVGSPFYSVATRQSFTVAPFYQGQASYFWELWVNIGGTEYKIWTKYQDLKYKTADGEWHSLTTAGVPAEAVQVEAPTYTYKATAGAALYFFLKVWTGGDSAHENDPEGYKAIKLSSLDNNMRALQGVQGLERPAGVPEDNFISIIGCEDNNASGSDGDYEDLAFLFFGPPTIRVDELEVSETKRYMMEDLGDTDDFDFNDVVVDVSNVYMNKVTWKENIATGQMEKVGEEEIPGTRHQEAIVRAAGGTLNFTLNIGGTTWTKSPTFPVKNMLNTGLNGTTVYYSGPQSELAKFTIANNAWNPEANNVSVTVYSENGTTNDEGVKTITFPKKGEAPKIIAVDPSVNWMKERQSVPGGTGSEDDWWN